MSTESLEAALLAELRQGLSTGTVNAVPPLSAPVVGEILREVEIAISLKNSGTSSAKMKAELEEIEKLAAKLWLKLSTLNFETKEALSDYCDNLAITPASVALQVHQIQHAAKNAASSIATKRGDSRPADEAKKVFAGFVRLILERAGIKISDYDHGPAAAVLRAAFEAAGMPTSEVRHYLRDNIAKNG